MAFGGEVHLSTRRPAEPDDADFALFIDFKKDDPRPERVFQAADAMIRAFQRLDKALCASIDNNIEPIMVLEEIEAGSIKIWLRNILTALDDQAIKDLDWKPAVGKYLVRAKWAYVRWSNKSEGTSLLDLAKEIRCIALETDVRHLPDYAPPSIRELSETAKEVDTAKGYLGPNDSMAYVDDRGEILNFDLTVRWRPEELTDLAVKETTEFKDMPMTLIVKKPDYLGMSKWMFRHGKKSIEAKIDDIAWLKKFQSRQIDVRPGDALKCLVTIQHRYGFDNELIDEDYTITKIEGVAENHSRQLILDE